MTINGSMRLGIPLILLSLCMAACAHTSSNDVIDIGGSSAQSAQAASNIDDPFVLTIEVLNDNTFFPIKLNNSVQGNVSYNIDCDNDNVYEHEGQNADSSCYYATKGSKIIKIAGDISGILLTDSENYQVTSIARWGKVSWKTMENFSDGCSKLIISATDAPDLSKAKSLKAMFKDAKSMNSPLNHWNVSTIEDMSEMFSGASSFNQALDKWDTSHVKNMDGMFKNAESFNQDISAWNVSNVRSMAGMFKNAVTFNQPLNAWNVGNVEATDMMFSGASAFNQPLDKWDVRKVQHAEYMFWYDVSFSQSLKMWKLENVTSVYGMFSGDDEFIKNNLDTITTWNEKYKVDVSSIFEKE